MDAHACCQCLTFSVVAWWDKAVNLVVAVTVLSIFQLMIPGILFLSLPSIQPSSEIDSQLQACRVSNQSKQQVLWITMGFFGGKNSKKGKQVDAVYWKKDNNDVGLVCLVFLKKKKSTEQWQSGRTAFLQIWITDHLRTFVFCDTLSLYLCVSVCVFCGMVCNISSYQTNNQTIQNIQSHRMWILVNTKTWGQAHMR